MLGTTWVDSPLGVNRFDSKLELLCAQIASRNSSECFMGNSHGVKSSRVHFSLGAEKGFYTFRWAPGSGGSLMIFLAPSIFLWMQYSCAGFRGGGF